MNIDGKVIEMFLDRLNKVSDIVEINIMDEDDSCLRFQSNIKTDLFVSSGILNYDKTYFDLIELGCKKFFNAEVYFNNTGSIFWIYKNLKKSS